MTIRATLEAINSRRDRAGNCYWAIRYTDHVTGRAVNGTISGGESNIYGILRYTGDSDDWDRSIEFKSEELTIPAWNRLTKGWPYAGCRPDELAAFIKAELEKQES